MREIKFRAWDEINGLMMSGADLEECEFDTRLSYGNLVVAYTDANGDFQQCLPMQFTGIQDRNGREIYEGDVVRWVAQKDSGLLVDTEMNGKLAKVVFYQHNAQFCFQFNNTMYYDNGGHTIQYRDRCEIIGNIYENPELLAEKATQ